MAAPELETLFMTGENSDKKGDKYNSSTGLHKSVHHFITIKMDVEMKLLDLHAVVQSKGKEQPC